MITNCTICGREATGPVSFATLPPNKSDSSTIALCNSYSSNPPDSSTYLLRLESIKLASEILYKSNDLDEIILMADKIFNYLKS